MSIWTELETLFGIAVHVVPIIAAENTAIHPNASNNALTNIASAMTAVEPLVQVGQDATSTTPLTGAQKLANAQAAISVAIQIGAAAGIITQPEAALLPLATQVINAAIAAKNAIPAATQTDIPAAA